jgi:hypothetical protein
MESSVIQSSSRGLSLYWVGDPALLRNSDEFPSCIPICAQGNEGNPLKLSDHIVCTLDPNTLRHRYKSDVIPPCWRAWGSSAQNLLGQIESQKWLRLFIFQGRQPIDMWQRGRWSDPFIVDQISLLRYWLRCFPNEQMNTTAHPTSPHIPTCAFKSGHCTMLCDPEPVRITKKQVYTFRKVIACLLRLVCSSVVR